MTSRTEAAAQALYDHHQAEADGAGAILIAPPADEFECCSREALKAADAHDAAQGIHRISLDEATIERAARIVVEDGAHGVPWEDASDDDRVEAVTKARTVLAAAVEAQP